MQLVRLSGLPVKLENIEAYKAEWTIEFDKLSQKHGLNMLDLEQDAMKLEADLSKKHQNILDVDFPKTSKAWKALLDEYKMPIMISTNPDTKKLVLVIFDKEI